MTSFDVPVRPHGGPAEKPPKPMPDLVVRLPNGNAHFVTKHARLLWDLLDLALENDELDDEDLDAAIALGILMKWPVAHLMRYRDEENKRRGRDATREQESAVWRAKQNEVLQVVAAHPIQFEWSLDGHVVEKVALPGDTFPCTRKEAERLDRAGRLIRPNPVRR